MTTDTNSKSQLRRIAVQSEDNIKDLLTRAAIKIGWKGWQSKHGYWNVTDPEGKDYVCCNYHTKFDPYTGEQYPEPTLADAIIETGWQPHLDDGDCLRLAVALDITIARGVAMRSINGEMKVFTFPPKDLPELRMAVLRAAAEGT